MRTACVSVLLAVLAGCGSHGEGRVTDEVPTDTWAHAVCVEFGDWRNDLRSSSGELQKGFSQAETLDEAKTVWADALRRTIRRTNQLMTALDGAGTPDLPRARATRRELRQLVVDLREAVHNVQSGLEDLPTDNEGRFAEGAAKLAEALGAELRHLQTETIAVAARASDDPELARALADPACWSVFGR